MSEDLLVVRVFNNEIEAGIAQQTLRSADVKCFVLKDDGGGMEPHLQFTGGVRLVVNQADAAHALDILNTLETHNAG